MKTCPICGSTCFDDMDICYGCLHPFDGDDSALFSAAEVQQTKVIPAVTRRPGKHEAAQPDRTLDDARTTRTDGVDKAASVRALQSVADIPLYVPQPATIDGNRFQIVISLQPVES